MTKDELKMLFGMITSVYPFFDPKDVELQKLKLTTWYEVLKDQNISTLKNNLIAWMRENDKAPLPSNLIEPKDWREEYEIYE